MSRNKKYYNPEIRRKNVRRNKLDEQVSLNFKPRMQDYLNYFEQKKEDKNNFFNLFKEFGLTKVNLERAEFVEFVDYLIDNKRIQGNRELYTHLINVLDYFVTNNLLHINNKNNYKESLNKILYSINQKYGGKDFESKYTKVDYSQYKKSDFRKSHKNQVLNEIYDKGGEIYFNKSNKISFKLSKNDKLEQYSKRNLESILSSIFSFNIKITDDVLVYEDIETENFIFKSKVIGVSDAKE